MRGLKILLIFLLLPLASASGVTGLAFDSVGRRAQFTEERDGFRVEVPGRNRRREKVTVPVFTPYQCGTVPLADDLLRQLAAAGRPAQTSGFLHCTDAAYDMR